MHLRRGRSAGGEEINLVVIATRHDSHANSSSARSNVASCLCREPLALNDEELDKVIAAATSRMVNDGGF